MRACLSCEDAYPSCSRNCVGGTKKKLESLVETENAASRWRTRSFCASCDVTRHRNHRHANILRDHAPEAHLWLLPQMLLLLLVLIFATLTLSVETSFPGPHAYRGWSAANLAICSTKLRAGLRLGDTVRRRCRPKLPAHTNARNLLAGRKDSGCWCAPSTESENAD